MTPDKKKVHRWVETGVATLKPTALFMRQLKDYVQETNDASLLAMTGAEAERILRFLVEQTEKYGKLKIVLQERMRISERQGAFSLQRKREIREERNNNAQIPVT